ncbi:STN domain-containing protein, partial [Butyricimonas virosa]
MEKKGKSGLYPREKLKLLARFQRALLLLIFFSLPIVSFGQEKKFTFSFKHVPISTVYLHIEKNSDYSFVYNTQEVQRIGLKDYKFENASIREILDYCLKETDLTYEIRDKHIIIHRDYQKKGLEEMVVVRGKVVGADDVVLPGVTVLLKGTVTGVTTDAEGKYSIFVPKKGATLIFSFVGMKTKEVVCGDKREINVTLEEDVQAMEEVVVTGYQTLRK